MKKVSNEFIIRALQRDGYEHAGFISSAASELLLHLANSARRLSPEILPPLSAEPEKIESPAARKKNPGKRLPVVY